MRKVYPQLLSERREKWRFVYRRIIIAIGIYEAHQAFSGGRRVGRGRGVGGRWFLKVTPDGGWVGGGCGSSDGADAAEQDSQTTCLRWAGLLNHHHSSHLYDHPHDISPVRAAAYAAYAAYAAAAAAAAAATVDHRR